MLFVTNMIIFRNYGNRGYTEYEYIFFMQANFFYPCFCLNTSSHLQHRTKITENKIINSFELAINEKIKLVNMVTLFLPVNYTFPRS